MSQESITLSNYKRESKSGIVPTYTKAVLSVLDKETGLTIREIEQKIKHILEGSSYGGTEKVIQDLIRRQFVDLKLIEEYQLTTILSEKLKIEQIVYMATEHTHPMLEITRLDKEMVFILKLIYETSCKNGDYSTIESVSDGLKGYILKRGTIPEYINQLLLRGILDPYQDGVRMSPEYWKYLDIIFKDMKARN